MTNKEIVLKFYEEVFNNWDKSVIDNYIKEDYIQHNPNAETGREGFKKFADFFLGLKPHMDIIFCAEAETARSIRSVTSIGLRTACLRSTGMS